MPPLTGKRTNVNSSLNIRGIGATSFSSGSEPAVSTVIDGVVWPRGFFFRLARNRADSRALCPHVPARRS